MELQLHTTIYDEQLQTALPHLVSYKQLLPFIGNAWPNQEARILLIAESHYLPSENNGYSNSATWYDSKSSQLTPSGRGWINTRGVMHAADHYSVLKMGFARGHSIFYNIKAAVFEASQVTNHKQTVFQNFGYYNYFQRPAEVSGESIINTLIDDQVAYNTLKAICNITKPTAVIFTSQKAYRSFKSQNATDTEQTFAGIEIQNLVHPATSWWNRKSSKLSANGIAETGKEKFMRSLKVYNFQLADTTSL